jgi:hypothetical protein
MVLVDGLDGYLATSTQHLAATGAVKARSASRWLGIVVVISSFTLGTTDLLGYDIDNFALPLGIALFVTVIAFRVWARRGPGFAPAEPALAATVSATPFVITSRVRTCHREIIF